MHGRAALGAAHQCGSQPALTGKQRHHASKGSHREKGKWRGIFYLWGGECHGNQTTTVLVITPGRSLPYTQQADQPGV